MGWYPRCTLGGRKRAAFWRTLDRPNLALAKQARIRNRRARKLEREFAEEKLRTPFALEKRRAASERCAGRNAPRWAANAQGKGRSAFARHSFVGDWIGSSSG